MVHIIEDTGLIGVLQRAKVMPDGPGSQWPQWHTGDSAHLVQLCQDNQCIDSDDLVLGPLPGQGKADAVCWHRLFVTCTTLACVIVTLHCRVRLLLL